jgi:hypothetical protein
VNHPTQSDTMEMWARAFVARVAGLDRHAERLAEVGVADALEEAALTLDVLIRDARIALEQPPTEE